MKLIKEKAEFNNLVKETVTLAQISDSHLFSDVDGSHHGHNVLANLKRVLQSVRHNPLIDYIVFTGDLTQDHSEQSYQNFVNVVAESAIEIPIYYLAGNHDEPELLAKYFSERPFSPDTTINHSHWQIQLIKSKSDTPAGFVSEETLINLQKSVDHNKQQLVMMHHHPIDVGYFIDKHGLQNKSEFWRSIDGYRNINAIACGHVHGAMQLNKTLFEQSTGTKKSVTVYTCPATSIQFDPDFDGVSALAKGPGYRLFNLYADGKLTSDVIYL